MDGAGTGQGSNAAIMRRHNERVILTALRRLGEASKSDLARHVNLTANAAGQIVRGLKHASLVREAGRRTGGRGQPATLLRLDPEGAFSIGVKLGRRSVDSLLVDFGGTVLRARRTEGTLPPPDEVLRIVRADVAALRRLIGPDARRRLAGVGLAMPYNLGSWRRELGLPEALSQAWRAFDLPAQLRASLDVPVFVENDGTAAALAELFGGVGRELDDFVVIHIGAAVGGGVVLGGACRRGAAGNAGDVGLMLVGPSGLHTAHAAKGEDGILLARASLGALLRHLGMPHATDAEARAGIAGAPKLVGEWVEDAAEALAVPVLSIHSLLDLQAVVLDGSLPRPVLERLLARLDALLRACAPEKVAPPVLRLGTHGAKAAALGAAILPLHRDYGADPDLLFAPPGGHA